MTFAELLGRHKKYFNSVQVVKERLRAPHIQGIGNTPFKQALQNWTQVTLKIGILGHTCQPIAKRRPHEGGDKLTPYQICYGV